MHRLINSFSAKPAEFHALSYDLQRKEKALLHRWNSESAAASYFKTDATRELDKAFASHADNQLTDEALLEKLNWWLKLKVSSNSSRYNLVIEMRERLHQLKKHSPQKTQRLEDTEPSGTSLTF